MPNVSIFDLAQRTQADAIRERLMREVAVQEMVAHEQRQRQELLRAIQERPISTITGRPEPTTEERMRPALATGGALRDISKYLYGNITNRGVYEETPSAWISKADPNYQPSIYGERKIEPALSEVQISAKPLRSYDEALFAHNYPSTYRAKGPMTDQEKIVRRLAYGIKGLEPEAVKVVSSDLSKIIPGNKADAILIPIPGHTGETASNLALANEIAEKTGARVMDILKRQVGPSQRTQRIAGKKTLKPEEFGMVATTDISPGNVYFIDNVMSSGATIRAAKDAIGGGRGLVYAKASPSGKKYVFIPALSTMFEKEEENQ